MSTGSALAPKLTLYFVPYFDEDVSTAVMEALRERGFEAHCARDEGMTLAALGRRVRDEEQLAYAVKRGWTIVTFNRGDFARLNDQYMENRLEHAGIIVSKRMTVGQMFRALLNLLDRMSADEIRNQLVYLPNFE